MRGNEGWKGEETERSSKVTCGHGQTIVANVLGHVKLFVHGFVGLSRASPRLICPLYAPSLLRNSAPPRGSPFLFTFPFFNPPIKIHISATDFRRPTERDHHDTITTNRWKYNSKRTLIHINIDFLRKRTRLSNSRPLSLSHLRERNEKRSILDSLYPFRRDAKKKRSFPYLETG